MSVISAQVKKMVELTTLHRHFQDYFRVVPAVTERLVEESQRIRHQVYCEELGWEPVKEDGLEQDYYDQYSVHCLLRSVSRESFVGCIRLVLPTDDGIGLSLPLQKACGGKLFPGHPDPVALANREVAEVSRLAITSDFRRRRHEKGKVVSFPEQETGLSDRRKFPYIPVALYLGMMEIATQRNINSLYFLTEPLLAKHFGRLGGELELIGEGIEHRGLRKPYLMDVEKVMRKVRLVLRPLIRVIRNDIKHFNKLKESGEPISFIKRAADGDPAKDRLIDYRDY